MTDVSARPWRNGKAVLVLRLFVLLTVIMGLVAAAGLVASFVAQAQLLAVIADRNPGRVAGTLMAFRVLTVLAMLMAAAGFVALGRMAEIVETARRGDPFVVENAGRLRTAAWALLVLALLDLPFSQAANWLHHRRGVDVPLGAALGVILLFVLARVFEQGARMREDLEGTV